MIRKREYLLFSSMFLSTVFVVAQDNDFKKEIIKESLNPRMMLNSMDSMSVIPRHSTIKMEIDPVNIKIPITRFNPKYDSISRLLSIEEVPPTMVVSPHLMTPYTNTDYLKDAQLPVGVNPFFFVEILKKILPYDDPVKPRISKKQKAMKRIKSVYGVD